MTTLRFRAALISQITVVILIACSNASAAQGISSVNAHSWPSDDSRLLSEGIDEYRAGHFTKAEGLLTQALESAGRLGRNDEVALISSALGDVYLDEERFAEAEQAYRKALTIFKQAPAKLVEVAAALRNLGAVYSLEQRDDEAIAVLNEAARLLKSNGIAQPELSAQILNSLGIAYFRQQKFGRAESLITQAMQISSASGAEFAAGQSLNNLAQIYLERRKFQKAERAYKDSLEITERLFGEMHPDSALTRANLGVLYTEMGRYEDAKTELVHSLAITEQVHPIVQGRVLRILYRLGIAYFRNGENAEAQKTLSRAAQIARHNPDLAGEIPSILEAYSEALQAAGKLQEAEALRAEAHKARAESALIIRAQSSK